jgi:DNA-binding CsgD family transcriptional regulator
VAAALAAAAEQARARGAAWPAAELAGHAARLSPDAQPRYDRAITAAQYLFGAGDAAGARHTLEALLGEALDDHMRARALLALSRVRMHELDFRPVISILERALACAEGDPSLQAEIRVMLAFQSDDDFPAGLAHVRAAVELLSEAGDPAALARALSAEMAMRDLCHGVVPATVIDGALAAERLAAPARVRDRPSYRLGVCLRSAGDVPAALVRLRAALAAVDAEQDEASRSEVLVSVVRAELLAGEWDAAWRHAAEAVDALMLPEQRAAEQIVRALQAEIDALRGLLVEAKATAEQVLRESAVAGAVIAPLFALAALGFASLCQDDPVAAVGYLKQADDLALSQGQGGPGNFPYHGDYAEALIWAGELDQAAAVIARLRAHGEELGRAWLLAVAERCQAMLCAARGDADGAISAAQSALDRHERLAIPFEAGRAHLAAGGIHRRAKHKRQAANHLSQAAIIFDKLGAPLWSARAHAELSRVGLRADSKFALTQTERQVAALVVQGLSNREVAGRLFVSVRTVESNLSRIYRKLGVRSRTEMVRAMAARELNMSGTDPVGLVAF